MLKIGGLGDLLMLTPTIRAYKKSFPAEKIYFVIGKSNEQVLKNNPHIDKLFPINDYVIFRGNFYQKANNSLKLINTIKANKAINIIVFHRDWRWNFIAFLSGTKHRYGFKRDFKGMFLNHTIETNSENHEINKYLEVCSLKEGFQPDGQKMDIFPLKKDYSIVENLLKEFIDNEKIVALAPGGATNVKMEMDLKRWPIENYQQLAEKILAETEYKIILIGSQSDLPFTRKILINNKRILDLAGKTNLAQTYLTLKRCRMLITHDSGPMHIGAAAGLKVISLFGPTYPKEYYPVTNPKSVYIWKGSELNCSPCYEEGKFPECPYNKKCMYQITAQEISDKIKQLDLSD